MGNKFRSWGVIYRWEKRGKEEGGSNKGLGRKKGGEVHKSRRGRLQPRFYQVRFLLYFFIILAFPFTFTWDSLAVFEKLFLLIGVDIEGHLFALLNRIFLQTCSVMIVFLISLILFINSWNRDLCLNFNVCGILI